MAALFTEETVKKAMEQCNWVKRDQFIPVAELKPKRLEKALACNAPGVRKEDVVAFRDETFLQSGKEGWILTANKIYFHEKYQLSSDRYGKKHIDFSTVKEITHQKGSSYIALVFQDGTRDDLDCYISICGDQIYEFLACIMKLYNAGYCDDLSVRKEVKQMIHERHLRQLEPVFPKYPSFVPADKLPDKKMVLLKKFLKNPFTEQIVGFHGNIDSTSAYGHLFTTQYYYFLSSGRLAEHISLWELVDVYPHHSDHEMTAILKDGTRKPLEVGTGITLHDELEALFQEVILRLHPTDPRGQHLKESPQEEERRTRVYRTMFQIRKRDIERPYAGMINRDLLARCKKLEASGDTEELPFLYEKIGYHSYPPADSYFDAKSWLYMPLSRFSLSYAFYYLYCLKHNLRFCDDKIRRHEYFDYQVFIRECNETPLEQVRERLLSELNTYRDQFE